MAKRQRFDLHLEPEIQGATYKKAKEVDKSVNKTINRLLNHALNFKDIEFEMQYLDKDERFGFVEDHKPENLKAEGIIYRLVEIDNNNGAFICETRVGNVKKFKYSEYFYKRVFII